MKFMDIPDDVIIYILMEYIYDINIIRSLRMTCKNLKLCVNRYVKYKQKKLLQILNHSIINGLNALPFYEWMGEFKKKEYGLNHNKTCKSRCFIKIWNYRPFNYSEIFNLVPKYQFIERKMTRRCKMCYKSCIDCSNSDKICNYTGDRICHECINGSQKSIKHIKELVMSGKKICESYNRFIYNISYFISKLQCVSCPKYFYMNKRDKSAICMSCFLLGYIECTKCFRKRTGRRRNIRKCNSDMCRNSYHHNCLCGYGSYKTCKNLCYFHHSDPKPKLN